MSNLRKEHCECFVIILREAESINRWINGGKLESFQTVIRPFEWLIDWVLHGSFCELNDHGVKQLVFESQYTI